MEEQGFNIKYLIIGILCTLQCVGVYEHFVNTETNNCQMTYMYEIPQYISIELPAELSSNFSRFGLYVYGEGQQAVAYEKGRFDGQPVLYIPGSAGSYKQVRSLASVAYRKSLDDDAKVHFDFFTADLSEDFSGFYGPVLQEQTDFIVAVIPLIQKLYLSPRPIILIGHSMGGLVARGVMAHGVTASSVPLIVTLATPHVFPFTPFDAHIQQYYEKVNVHWALEKAGDGELSDVTVVSVSGGRNDVLVSTLSAASPFSHVTSVASAVPGCWATTDHLSIVWCKQLVLALVRALFDSYDARSSALYASKTRITAVFEYHLLTRHSGKRFVSQRYKRQLKFAPSTRWQVMTERQFEHVIPAHSPQSYVLVPLMGPGNKQHTAVVRVRGLDEKDWVFACAATEINGTLACTSGMNLSKRGRLLGGDSDASRAKMVEALLPALVHEGYSHLGVSVPPSEHPVTVSVDVHGEGERRVAVATPRLVSSFKPTTVLQSTATRALVTEVVLEGLNEPWHSYDLSVLPSSTCPVNAPSGPPPPQLWVSSYTSSAIALAPHKISGKEYVYRLEQDEIALLPSGPGGDSAAPERGDLTVQLLLEPRCHYSISVKASLQGTFRRLFLLYSGQIPAFIVCHLLLALAMQMKSVGDKRYCPSVMTSLLALTPMLVVPFVKLSAMALKKLEIFNDQQMLTESGMDLGLLPIYMFLAWMPVTLLLSGGVWVGILAAGNALYSTVVRIFGGSFGAAEVVVDIALTGLSKVPAVVAVALLAVAFSTCGALALSLASLYYFITMFDMYKDYLRKVILRMIPRLQDETPPPPPAVPASAPASSGDSSSTSQDAPSTADTPTPAADAPQDSVIITRKSVPQSAESLELQLHLTLLLLCVMASLLQLPSLITWAVRIKQGHALSAVDPSLPPSVACLVSLAVLWQCSPVHERQFYKALGHLIHFLAVLVLLFATISFYKLPYFIAAALGLVALHQLFAPAKAIDDKIKTQ